MIRVLYMGQKWIGEKCFQYLKNKQGDSLHIGGAVSNTSTDVWWKSNAIYMKSCSEGIPFLSNEHRNNKEIKILITENDIDTIIAVQHPWILPKDILELVNFQAFNLHNAKLPEYKGHNACNHAILNGDQKFTSTLHWLDVAVDEGAIIFEETFGIDKKETAKSLYEKAAAAGERIFNKLIDYLLQGKELPEKPIQGSGSFYPRHSIDRLREIKDIHDVQELDRKAWAFFFPPFEPAYFILNDIKYYILPDAYDYHGK